MPYGAELIGTSQVRFRLWAPDRRAVSVERDDGTLFAMTALDGGWFECIAPCDAGTAYRYRLQSEPDSPGMSVPDPASRQQRGGDVHGFSVVADPHAYHWQHPRWRGRPWHETVIYELHVGVMGGFAGVQRALPALAALGITAVELMPVAQFPGRRNWGYDGVLPYAPAAAYGTPEELKALIDAAHGLGLMVFLDVVYNHFGPDGNYLSACASGFFHDADTPWGASMAVGTPAVGGYFAHNALYWLEEFRFDGLRFDAVHALDNPAWLVDLAVQVREALEPDRHVHLMLENEANQASLLASTRFDAQWNDDFHNALHALLTGEDEGYYAHYHPAMPLLLRTLREGFAYQGEAMGEKQRGESSGHLPPVRFVQFLQNHDQVGNRAFGERLTSLIAPEIVEAALVLLLLSPGVPLLFMGEEVASQTPFLFFTDFTDPALREAVTSGRRKEFEAFAGFAGREIPDPNAADTFYRSVVEPHGVLGERRRALIVELLALRRTHLWPHLSGAYAEHAQALSERALCASWILGGSRLGVWVNFGDADVPIDEGPLRTAQWVHGQPDAIDALYAGVLRARCALVCLQR
jgi:malto-oligosyltrehalose trehalohydrolase